MTAMSVQPGRGTGNAGALAESSASPLPLAAIAASTRARFWRMGGVRQRVGRPLLSLRRGNQDLLPWLLLHKAIWQARLGRGARNCCSGPKRRCRNLVAAGKFVPSVEN